MSEIRTCSTRIWSLQIGPPGPLLHHLLGTELRDLSMGALSFPDGYASLASTYQAELLAKLVPSSRPRSGGQSDGTPSEAGSPPSPVPMPPPAGPVVSCAQLTSLALTKAVPQVALQLSKALRHLSQLRQLRLKKLQLTDNCAVALSTSLRSLPELRALDVSDNRLHNRGIVHLSSGIVLLPYLQELMLQHNFFGGSGIAAVVRVARQLSRLTKLDLGAGLETDPAVVELRQLPRLLELTL